MYFLIKLYKWLNIDILGFVYEIQTFFSRSLYPIGLQSVVYGVNDDVNKLVFRMLE